mgnify:CR=1 FL=1
MKLHLLLLPVLVALAVGCGSRAPAQPESVQVKITGMHCEGCAETITKKLRQAGGLLRSDIHFSNDVQTVHYDGARTEVDRMVAVITNLGYEVELVSDAR